MKNTILVIVLLVASAPCLLATTPAGQELLAVSKQQANIFKDQVEPFQLEVDFRAQFAKDLPGHLTWKWKAKDRWWRRIAMEGFEQIDIRNGEMLYTKRNIAFTPQRIKELIKLLQVAQGSEELVVKKQKQRVENGTAVTCIEAEGKPPARTQQELCLNSASHDILSHTALSGFDERHKQEYSDYVEFAGSRYPRKLQLRVNGSNVISATVQSLASAQFDESLLTVPNGAIERRQCADMQRAVPINAPEPVSLESALQSGTRADLTAVITVLTDGSVGDVQVIGNAARWLKDAAVQTYKTWKFKPARCGQEAIISDYETSFGFRINSPVAFPFGVEVPTR